MGSSRLSLRRVLLLSAFFAASVLAQNDDDETTTETPDTPTTTTAQQTSQTTTTGATQTTSQRTTTSVSSSSPIPTLPGLSSSSTTSQGTRPPMPSLTRTSISTDIPEYPPPTIPPTQNAPFMNHSTLPDGTVFIAVGAILGAFGLAILAWRGIVACLLHRSVERAAMAQHAANNAPLGKGGDKNAASFPAPPAQFYKYIERESSASLAGAGMGGGAAGSAGRRTHRGPTPSATPSQTNLFFSPTAAGSASALGSATGASNRDSARFLPSGFYASASPVPGGGGGHGHGHGNSISMSTLRPSSRGRALGPSPPESPDVGPRVVSRNFSTSSLNLNRPPSPGARAPSAYLDDLLDEQPGMFPPSGTPSPQGRGRY